MMQLPEYRKLIPPTKRDMLIQKLKKQIIPDVPGTKTGDLVQLAQTSEGGRSPRDLSPTSSNMSQTH